MSLFDTLKNLPPAALRGLLNTVDGDDHTTLMSGLRAGLAGQLQGPALASPEGARGLLAPSDQPRGVLSQRSGGVLSSEQPPALPGRASAPEPRAPKSRDPSDFTFGDYALGALASGSILAPAAMMLRQRQRHRDEDRNRAGLQAFLGDLGLGGQPQEAAPARSSLALGPGYRGMGPGVDGAPVGGAPPTPEQPRLTRSQLLLATAKARARGFDTSAYAPILNGLLDEQDTEQFLSTVPGADRTLARVNPKGYADYQLERRKPRSGENDTVEFNPTTGKYEVAYAAQPKIDPDFMPDPDKPGHYLPRPGLKADPQYIARVAGLRAKETRENAPPMWAVYGPSAGGSGGINSTGDVIGPILGKVAKGQPLTPGERELYENTRRAQADPFGIAGLLAQRPGGAPAPGQAQPPPKSPPKPTQPPRSGPRLQPQNGVYRPTSEADMASVPKGAKFIEPRSGQVMVKNR